MVISGFDINSQVRLLRFVQLTHFETPFSLSNILVGITLVLNIKATFSNQDFNFESKDTQDTNSTCP